MADYCPHCDEAIEIGPDLFEGSGPNPARIDCPECDLPIDVELTAEYVLWAVEP